MKIKMGSIKAVETVPKPWQALFKILLLLALQSIGWVYPGI